MSRQFILLPLIFTLSCCTARIPEPIGYDYSQQHKMQASHHWEVLAGDLADRINNQLILSDNIQRPVFVKTTCGDESTPCDELQTSSFNEAFRDLLITGLVRYGVPTDSAPRTEAIQVQYKVQIVRHNGERVRTVQPGILTALSAAIVVLRDAPSNLLILATGALTDAANTNLVINGKYEVIITTSMVDGGRYLFRSSDIYYINDKDFLHYRENMPSASTVRLSSKAMREEPAWHRQSPPPLPVPEEGEESLSTEKKGI
jgi:hypothetical protein